MISIMNSSNYLIFPHVIAHNYHQNFMRKMFVFGITISIPVSIKNTEIPVLCDLPRRGVNILEDTQINCKGEENECYVLGV